MKPSAMAGLPGLTGPGRARGTPGRLPLMTGLLCASPVPGSAGATLGAGRPARASKLEPHKPEIERLLRDEPRMPAMRIRELIAQDGYTGGQTILDVWVREVRPRFLPAPRVYQRTRYRPGELAQFDVWEPSEPIPVGHGQARKGYVVVTCLGYSRAGAGALVFSKRAPDLLWGVGRCLFRLGALPQTLVWDREGA